MLTVPRVIMTAVALSLALTVPAAAKPPLDLDRGSVPLGTALWYACTVPAFSGPPPLRCPVAYDERYAATFAARFDRLTPENELKMVWTQPSRGRFDFSVTDRIADLADSQGKKVRGHTLIYAAANPRWIDRQPLLEALLRPWNRNRLLATMRNHIATVVGRYRTRNPGTFDEWDVVNEPFLDSGARDPNIYQRVIGDDWIEQAFRAARAADPDALLFLNEFNADTPGPRQQAVFELVSDFVRRGVPIDGVGMEMHIGADGRYPTLGELKSVMAQYATLGLRVAVTELDVLRPVVGDPVLVQRAAYDTVARACQESTNCTGVTGWGVADRYSWRGTAQQATMFTRRFTRKNAYDRVRCHLGDPKPAGAPDSWMPSSDCGPIEIVPPDAVTAPPGSTDGPSVGSDPTRQAPERTPLLPTDRITAPPAPAASP